MNLMLDKQYFRKILYLLNILKTRQIAEETLKI